MEKRNTVQKQLVLDAVARLANHPTADAVYNEVVRSHPSVSKATVYRNLTGLAQDGLIRHVAMADGADRFDHCVSYPHDHIVCTTCGAFGDAPIVTDASMDALVSEQTGYHSVQHDIVYNGECPVCAKKHS
ncbi:MAG: transcriptional repressor [Ruthenibacterium sp.]